MPELNIYLYKLITVKPHLVRELSLTFWPLYMYVTCTKIIITNSLKRQKMMETKKVRDEYCYRFCALLTLTACELSIKTENMWYMFCL